MKFLITKPITLLKLLEINNVVKTI
uniref:Uncharacterized protein n=1 Tax=Lepeophtheirus salmonis TaxID=72036 RepID=A0A0K2TPR4_LEPSM